MKKLALIFLAGCSYWTPDNPIEEAVEAGIEQATGVDIDLSADDEEGCQKLKLMEF